MKGHLVCYGKKINLAGNEEFMNIFTLYFYTS